MSNNCNNSTYEYFHVVSSSQLWTVNCDNYDEVTPHYILVLRPSLSLQKSYDSKQTRLKSVTVSKKMWPFICMQECM